MLGLVSHDCTSGFRCYHAELLRGIALDQIRSNGYSFLIEVLYLCERAGATVREIPIIFEDRQFGASKISQVEILQACQTVYRLAKRRLSARLDLHGKQVR